MRTLELVWEFGLTDRGRTGRSSLTQTRVAAVCIPAMQVGYALLGSRR